KIALLAPGRYAVAARFTSREWRRRVRTLSGEGVARIQRAPVVVVACENGEDASPHCRVALVDRACVTVVTRRIRREHTPRSRRPRIGGAEVIVITDHVLREDAGAVHALIDRAEIVVVARDRIALACPEARRARIARVDGARVAVFAESDRRGLCGTGE